MSVVSVDKIQRQMKLSFEAIRSNITNIGSSIDHCPGPYYLSIDNGWSYVQYGDRNCSGSDIALMLQSYRDILVVLYQGTTGSTIPRLVSSRSTRTYVQVDPQSVLTIVCAQSGLEPLGNFSSVFGPQDSPEAQAKKGGQAVRVDRISDRYSIYQLEPSRKGYHISSRQTEN